MFIYDYWAKFKANDQIQLVFKLVWDIPWKFWSSFLLGGIHVVANCVLNDCLFGLCSLLRNRLQVVLYLILLYLIIEIIWNEVSNFVVIV